MGENISGASSVRVEPFGQRGSRGSATLRRSRFAGSRLDLLEEVDASEIKMRVGGEGGARE